MKRNNFGVLVANDWRDFAPHTHSATDLMVMQSDAQASKFCKPDDPADFLAYLNQDGQATDAAPDYEGAARQWCEELRREAEASRDGHVLNRAITFLGYLEGWMRCQSCNGDGIDEPNGFTCQSCLGSGWMRR